MTNSAKIESIEHSAVRKDEEDARAMKRGGLKKRGGGFDFSSAVAVRAIASGTVAASVVGCQDRRGVGRAPCELPGAAGGPARAGRAGRLLPAGRRRV